MTQPNDRCINPTELADGDLVAYADGEANAATISHLERCSFCRNEARLYAGLERVMTTALYRRSCIPSMTLGEYAMGLLEASEMRRVAEHLLDCGACLAESRSLSKFLAEPDEPIPEPGLLTRLRRLIAVREARTPALMGLRGTATGESVTYIAEDCMVRLSVQAGSPGRPGKVIAGSVERRSGDLTDSVAQLFDGERLLQTEDVDDLGMFQFSRVAPGSLRIEVTLSDDVVVIESIRVE